MSYLKATLTEVSLVGHSADLMAHLRATLTEVSLVGHLAHLMAGLMVAPMVVKMAWMMVDLFYMQCNTYFHIQGVVGIHLRRLID